MSYALKRGMGTYMVTDLSTGQQIDCDSWSNLFNLSCWGFGAAVDTTVGAPSVLTLPAPTMPSSPTQAQLNAVSSSSDPGTAASDLTQQLSDQSVSQTQLNISAANPSGGTPDCSAFLAPFITPGCGSTFSLTEWLLIGGAVAVGLIILKGMVR